ncbi:aldo/keto reductase [bacterium]|nr:aldo/keto reductase [bacterium]
MNSGKSAEQKKRTSAGRRPAPAGRRVFRPDPGRYEKTVYRTCGRSGLKLPPVSLGLWHNFGGVDRAADGRRIVLRAFDLGVTHFDLANNYGPPPGSAETNFGRILKADLASHRDELIISTKAGYRMWPGPCGEWGSRKTLLASLDQSLRRLGLEYVDIYYSHRYDPETPLAETASALIQAVRSGKALYAGISNYPPGPTETIAALLRFEGVPLLIHQMKYSMFVREPESGLFGALEAGGIGGIAFSPLAQGLLTDRYRTGVPADSRAAKPHGFLQKSEITPERQETIRALEAMAQRRGQTLAQMAIAWVLRQPVVTSALIGASRVEQLESNLKATENRTFGESELSEIDGILGI